MGFGSGEALFGIALNLISAAMWDLAHDPLYAESYNPTAEGSQAYAEAVGVAMERLAPALEAISEQDFPTVEDFLGCDEVRQLVMQIYRAHVSDPPAPLAVVRDGIHAVWMSRYPEAPAIVDIDMLLDALIAGCDAMLNQGIKHGSLSAHEATSAARHASTVERLGSIERQIGLIHQAAMPSAERINAFEERVRTAAARSYNMLMLAGASPARAMPISEVYVPPPFTIDPLPEPTVYQELVGQTFRMVILGGPGAGKSSFAQKLCRDLAMRTQALSGGLRSAGILLRLRSLPVYGDSETKVSDQIRAGIDYVTEHELRVPLDPVALEYLLIAGRLALVLDGLDELPTAEARLRLHGGLDSFAERYPLVPLVVTSRIVGYEDAPLDPQRFRRAWLGDYTKGQAEQFAQCWFSVNSADEDTASASAQAVMQQSSEMPDLRSSPIMLGLLCGLHSATGLIPRSGIGVYESYVNLFFQEWDRDYQIPRVMARALIRPELAAVAWRMLWNPDLAEGISESELHHQVEISFHQKIAISSEGQAGADDFVECCRGRRWLFAETGVDKHGEQVFNFTHRTFMEFLAAEHLATYLARRPENQDEFTKGILKLVFGGHEAVAVIAAGLYVRSGQDDGDLAAEILGWARTTEEQRRLEAFVERWGAAEAV